MKKLIWMTLLIPMIIMISFAQAHAKPFYEGKVIKIIVATKPGGGYDYYARLLATYMQKYLPGSTVIVKNMPGAGHIIGANAVYMAKPDGLTLGTFNRAVGISQVVGVKGVRFDFPKYSWIGAPASELYSFIVSKDKFRNIDDVLAADNVKLSVDGLGSINYVTILLFYQMLGKSNFTVGFGYAGGEAEMAVMRKEMDGTWGSFWSRKQMIDGGYGRAVLFIGSEKPPGFEDVPFIQDVVRDKKQQPIIDLLQGFNLVGRPFVGPPGIPAERLKVLQEVFKKAVYTPSLIEAAKKAQRPINYISPEVCERWAKGLMNLSPDVVATLKKAYGVK